MTFAVAPPVVVGRVQLENRMTAASLTVGAFAFLSIDCSELPNRAYVFR